MRTQILKGVLLWVTALSILFFIMGGAESLIEWGKWLLAISWLVINLALGYCCWRVISFEEAYRLSGTEWIDKTLKIEE